METQNTQQTEESWDSSVVENSSTESIWDSDMSMGFEMTPEVWKRSQ